MGEETDTRKRDKKETKEDTNEEEARRKKQKKVLNAPPSKPEREEEREEADCMREEDKRREGETEGTEGGEKKACLSQIHPPKLLKSSLDKPSMTRSSSFLLSTLTQRPRHGRKKGKSEREEKRQVEQAKHATPGPVPKCNQSCQ
mmetsp:Transcript_42079/g.83066  ORF Transcript_42079/g.83066 Transcript_42079/m.83066 type:complete len:145 (-) Transcript_42079:938-1372(-)